MSRSGLIVHRLGTPFRALANAIRVLVNLTSQQMRALFSLAMIGGMISLSFQNVAFTYAASRAVERGETFKPLFDLIQEQMRFNSGLIAWFAAIMGLIVFGADHFRAKHANSEVSFGRGPAPAAPAAATAVAEPSKETGNAADPRE